MEWITFKEYSKWKDELRKEIEECRHGWKNEASKKNFAIDKHETEIALLKQSHINMTEKIQEVKTEMHKGFSHMEGKMEEFLVGIDNKYATKIYVKWVSMKVSIMYWIFATIWSLTLAWLIWKILELI